MIRRVYEHVSPIAALGIVIVVLMAANVVSRLMPGSLTAENSAARLERRQAAREGRLSLPLPGTPDTEAPLSRLASVGVKLGARTMIRVFKAESEFEVWVQKDGAYVHFATYPVCFWSGKLGPKLREGDRQTPEGFYTITSEQLHFGDRWQRSLDIGFPNVFDRINGRTGSVILVHGGCDSSGCFAMTNKVSEEIYEIVAASLRSGQQYVPVHVFPFRMSAENIAAAGGRSVERILERPEAGLRVLRAHAVAAGRLGVRKTLSRRGRCSRPLGGCGCGAVSGGCNRIRFCKCHAYIQQG